jgi:hypothetical protein
MSPRHAPRDIALSQPGMTTSSASQKARNSPRARRAATLRARPGPRPLPADPSSSRAWGSRGSHCRTRSRVPSRDPASETMSSQSPSYSWPASASSWASTVPAASRTGSTTLIVRGAGRDRDGVLRCGTALIGSSGSPEKP